MGANSLQLSRALLVAELSAQGATISSVAERLSCTPSAISQALDAAPELQEEIMKRKLQGAQKGIELDDKYDKLEHTVLTKLEQVLPYVTDPMKLGRLAQTLNAAKRRAGPQVKQASDSQVVTLLLPELIKSKLELSSQKEVVQIGDRVLVTMPAAQVAAQLKDRQQKELERRVELINTPPVKIGDML